MQLTIVPFSSVNGSQIDRLADILAKHDYHAVLAKPVPLPENAYNTRRRQYAADPVLNSLRAVEGEHILGIVEVDLYRYICNCVYGLAELPGRLALVSTYRLRQQASPDIIAQRLGKLVLHELGHTRGLEHCASPDCVMRFSANLDEMDLTRAAYCSACLDRLNSTTPSLFASPQQNRQDKRGFNDTAI